MRRSERRELISRLAVLLAHLLKWQHQPSLRGNSWSLAIREQRRKLARHLRDNPSLTAQLDDALADAYGDAILAAQRETGMPDDVFSPACAWAKEEVLDSEFLPS